MAQIKVVYDEHRRWWHRDNRPREEVRVHGPYGRTIRLASALVDTGADTLVLSAVIATHLGIDLTQGTKQSTKIVGGLVTMRKIRDVPITIETKKVRVDCLFCPGNTTPLLGRTAALAAFENLGFDANGWMFKLRP